MAEKVYKEPMQDLRTVSPELVEVPTAKAVTQALELSTTPLAEVEATPQTKNCQCGREDTLPSLGDVIRAQLAKAEAEKEEARKAQEKQFQESHIEQIWTSVYDFNGPGKFADDRSFGKWWEGPGKQIFNLIYFALGGAACYVIAQTSGYLYKTSLVGICLFAALTVAATIYAICHGKPSSQSDVLSERAQKFIRRAALAAPLLAILVAGWNCLTYGVDYIWAEGYYPRYQSNMSPADYEILKKEQVELAATISPLNTEVAKRHFERAKEVGSYVLAEKMATKVIRFNRRDSRWKIRRLGVIGRLPDREQEFQTLTKKYKKRYGNDGYLWNTLADTAVYNKDWPLALEMANEHVRIHDSEAIAYEQRASILRELGMNQEAENDLASANSFSSNNDRH